MPSFPLENPRVPDTQAFKAFYTLCYDRFSYKGVALSIKIYEPGLKSLQGSRPRPRDHPPDFSTAIAPACVDRNDWWA